MPIVGLSVAETAPLADDGCKLVPLVKLDILHWMAQAKFLNARAPHYVSLYFNYGQIVDELLCIGGVGLCRQLSDGWVPILVIECILGVAEHSHGRGGQHPEG